MLAQRSSPAISPRYSATLLVASPMYSARSASTSPVSASSSTAPYAAGPGLPREPPSASMTGRTVPSGLRARTRRCAPGCGGTPRSAAPRRARRLRDRAEVGGVELEAAALAAALAQRGRADAALLTRGPCRRASAGRRRSRRRRSPCARASVSATSPSSSPAFCARAAASSRARCRAGRSARGQLVELGLRGLEALHHLELDVLEVGLPALQRDDLVLQALAGPWGW